MKLLTLVVAMVLAACASSTPSPTTTGKPEASPEIIEQVELVQTRGYRGYDPQARAWSARLEGNGKLSLEIERRMLDERIVQEDRLELIQALFTVIQERGLLELPAGGYGTNVADIPTREIRIRTDRQSLRFELGVFAVAEHAGEEAVRTLIALEDTWRELVKGLPLPESAVLPNAKGSAILERYRAKYGERAASR